MLEPDHWTIAERYMVRHHLTHILWWALGSISAIILALGLVLALTTIGTPAPNAMWRYLWYGVFVLVPAITGASFVAKDALLARAIDDWKLFRLVIHYKNALIAVYLFCLIAGLLPCVAALVSGSFGYPLLIELVPLGAMFVNFPHDDRFQFYVEDVLHAASA